MSGKTVDVKITVRGVNKLASALQRAEISTVRGQARTMRTVADALDKKADLLVEAYVERHGMTPAEHKYRLMVERKLQHPRWSPQP